VPTLPPTTKKKPHSLEKKGLHAKGNYSHNKLRLSLHKQNMSKPKRNLPLSRSRNDQPQILPIQHDVIAKVGHLYFKEHKTIDQIKQTLNKLRISRSEINLLYQAYLALTTVNRQQDTTFLEKIRANGGIT
jgi:hypothetical protein